MLQWKLKASWWQLKFGFNQTVTSAGTIHQTHTELSLPNQPCQETFSRITTLSDKNKDILSPILPAIFLGKSQI